MPSRFGLAVTSVLVLWAIWRQRKKSHLYSSKRRKHSVEVDALHLRQDASKQGANQSKLYEFPECTKIVVCRDEKSCEKGIAELLASSCYYSSSVSSVVVLGLDVEWRPKKDKNEETQPVAVVQLSNGKITLVIQLLQMGRVPNALRDLLANKRILKVGVGVSGDALALQRSYNSNSSVNIDNNDSNSSNEDQKVNNNFIDVRGCLELELLLARTVNCGGLHGFSGGTSLKALAQNLLDIEIDKNQEIRCSDWSVAELTNKQIMYAAADAFYSWAIFNRLLRIRYEAMIKKVSAGENNSLNLEEKNREESGSICLDDDSFNGFVAGLVDARREKNKQKLLQQQLPQQQKKTNYKEGRPNRFESITKNLYDNFRVEGPNGEFMFTCDRKKRNWYIDRNLATLVEDNPQLIRLTFQPKGLGNQGSAFYEEGLDNKCVVCGVEKNLVRHNVIPHSFRRHFPLRIKSHSSHDVVLMCVPCHAQAQVYSEQLKTTISREMNIPLNTPQEMVTVDVVSQKVRNSALALTGPHATRIPLEKRKELLATVGRYFECGEDDVTSEMLHEAKQLSHRSVLSPEDAHEAHVVQAVFAADGIGGIHSFCKRWREHMVNTLDPKFLSPHWDVNFIKPNDEDLIP